MVTDVMCASGVAETEPLGDKSANKHVGRVGHRETHTAIKRPDWQQQERL